MNQGRPAWNPDLSDISDTFHAKRGNVSAIALHYGVHRDTVHRYINSNIHVKKLLEEARTFHSEDEKDLAISLNFIIMNDYKNNPHLASKHCIKTLELKCQSRGYIRDVGAEPLTAKNQPEIDKDHIIMTQAHHIIELESNGNKCEAE